MKKFLLVLLLLGLVNLSYAAQYSNIPEEDILNNVYVSGTSPSLRVDIGTSGLLFGDNEPLKFGDANPDAAISWDTAQTTDAWYFGTGGSNNLIIAEQSDGAFDFAHADSTNPTVFIHSAALSTTQWLSLAHDQTDAVITSGTGQINLVPNNGLVGFPGAAGAGTPRFLIRSASGGQAGFELGEGSVSTLTMRARGDFDQGTLALASGTGNQLVLTTTSNVDQDHDHATTTNPTIFNHSATAPNTSNNQWACVTHNGNNMALETGDNVGVGTAPTTIDNGIIFGPRQVEQMRITGIGGVIYVPRATEDVVAATGITTAMLAKNVKIQGSGGAIDITANPQITAGYDGQEVRFIGRSNTNTVQFDDGTGVSLDAATAFVMGRNDTLSLTFISGDNVWIETGRTNITS